MNISYHIEGCEIEVSFGERIIHIINNAELTKLLAHNIEERTAQLVKWIKEKYNELRGEELQITDDSLMVEIWGHIYFERFALAIKHILNIKITNQLAKIAVKRGKLIDCGEKSIDNNRFLWDAVAPFKKLILKILPRDYENR